MSMPENHDLNSGNPEPDPQGLSAPIPPPVRGGGRSPLSLLVAAVAAAAMLYVGFHMARRTGAIHGRPAVTKSSVAPDFTLESLDGKKVSLSEMRGKAVLLNFWATWCGPCKIETPWLVELQSQYGAQGLEVVGVSLDDDATKVEIGEFADTMRINYPILIGDEKVANAYGGIPAMPVTFFVGRDGKIVDRIIGLKGKGEIEDVIKRTLDPKVDNTPSSATPGLAPRAQK